MSDVGSDDRALAPLAGGRLLAEITNRIVAFMREHYGRGPIKAKTYVLDNLIVCVLTDGFTAIERTMMEGGEPQRVLDMRRDFQRMMKERYSEMIEQLTGRKVLAFLSQAHVEPDLTIEIFLMDGPLAGFGALELSTRHRPTPPAARTNCAPQCAETGRRPTEPAIYRRPGLAYRRTGSSTSPRGRGRGQRRRPVRGFGNSMSLPQIDGAGTFPGRFRKCRRWFAVDRARSRGPRNRRARRPIPGPRR